MSLIIYWYEIKKASGVEEILSLPRLTLKALKGIAVQSESPEFDASTLSTILGVLGVDYHIEFPKLPRRLEVPLLQFWKKGCEMVQGGPEAELLAAQIAGIRDMRTFTQQFLDYTKSEEDLEKAEVYVTEALNWLRDKIEGLPPGRFGMLGFA